MTVNPQTRRSLLGLGAGAFLTLVGATSVLAGSSPPPLTILVHGGAGALEEGRYTVEEEAAFLADLEEALRRGYAILAEGGAALDAVSAAVVFLEDSPHFNAGRGSVFTRDGKNELDASIMDGATRKAGAVAGVTRIKNPVKLARAVLDRSEHVMMIGEGAEEFAREHSLEFVDPAYFRTERRWLEYRSRLEAEEAAAKGAGDRQGAIDPADARQDKYGTVGAVAIDADGHLAAATSTGGMTMKRYGRVGDVPIIGAGVYADDGSCAVSSTGWGEFFIRLAVAREICAQVEYLGVDVGAAADDVIHNRLQSLGGDGGVIVIGPDGSHAMTFNSKGMFRGVLTEGGKPEVAIYGAPR